MFKASATNPFDDLVVKATNEDLVSEDWDTNLQICDKVTDQGEEGAKNVIAALIKRLSHRNPNVQIFALELANSLAQNCPPPPLSTLLPRLVIRHGPAHLRSDDAAESTGEGRGVCEGVGGGGGGGTGGGGVLGELVESLRGRKINVDEPAAQAKPREDDATRRAREEEEDLRKAIELSKQDVGGSSKPKSNSTPPTNPPTTHSTAPIPTPQHSQSSSHSQPQPFPARSASPPPMPTRATASRVRAIYPFVTHEKGELSFDKGDVIKVIDRMYDEWYTGAVGGRIGIFPISYVEPLPEPTPEELRQEAQEEAKVFAAQGMIVNLQRMLDGLDPTRGDRVDSAELEEMYQKVVELQPQIVGLMKKYADQRAELEHIHLGFVKASKQYAVLTQRPQAAIGYGYPGQDPYATHQHPQAHRQSSYGSAHQAQAQPVDPAQQAAAEQHAAAWAAYYAQQQALAQQQFAATGQQPQPQPGQPQEGQPQPGQQPVEGQTQAEREHIAAWQAYYAAQAAQMQAAGAAGGYGQPGQGQAAQTQPGQQGGQQGPAGSHSPQPHAAQQQVQAGFGSPGQAAQQQAQPQFQQQQYPQPQQQQQPPHQPHRGESTSSELPNPYGGQAGGYAHPAHHQQASQGGPSPGQVPHDPAAGQYGAYPNVQPYAQQSAPPAEASHPPQPQHSPTLSQRAPPSGQTQQPHPGYPAQSQSAAQFPNPQPYHNPYAQSHNPQAISSQSSLGSYAQPNGPPHGGSMPGLERAVSNLSMTGQPQPSGSDPIRFT